MGLVQETVKAVYCPTLEAYTPIEACRTCSSNEGYAFAKDHHHFGVICAKSVDGFVPEPLRNRHKLTLKDDSWQ